MGSGFDLTGQRILITGAAGGIGASTARVCTSLGAAVVLVDRVPAEALAVELRGSGAVATAHLCDVAVRGEVEALVAAVGAIDALVASAAICPWDNWDDLGWDDICAQVLAVNVLGPIHCARALLPGMIARGAGRIVLVGSLAGRTGGLIASPHYVAAKGGVHALVRWLARRAAPHGVLVNGVAPASVDTPMMAGQSVDLARIPLGRMATPAEIAWPIAFLCSAAASYVCGAVLDVNGGVHMA
jgi:NAD(P)-dependent dehydrogenase (short-subunit alcohol dehydrogenase family)